MSEMIERVARALSIADGMHPEACSNDEDETPMWTLYLDDAKAAIDAMLEPTQEMLKAPIIAKYAWRDDEQVEPEEIADTWRSMVKVALGKVIT